MVGVEVHRARTLAGAQLVRVGEGVLQQLHHRDHAGGLVLDLLDRRAVLTDVGQRQRNAPAALGQLQRGVDAAGDGLHVVLDAQQEAGDELAALLLAGVEEGGGGRLEAPGDDLLHELLGLVLIPTRQVQGHHADTVLETLQVALAVEGLQRVGGVELEGAQEGREAELRRIGAVPQPVDELAAVLLQGGRLVVVILDQVLQLLVQVMEEDRVDVDVVQEVLPGRQLVGLELDLPVRAVQVQHGVELVVAQALPLWGDHLGQCRLVYAAERLDCCFQNSSNPCLTRATSSAVPMSSNLYRCGTPHFWATMSPAMQ